MEPKISQRAKHERSSPIRKLVDVIGKRVANGLKVHYLNIGQPDVPSPQQFLDAVHAFYKNPIAYAHSQGDMPVRKAWCDFYKTRGFTFEPNQVVITQGGSEALLFALAAICDPGDDVITFEPFYANYRAFSHFVGAKLNPIPRSLEEGFHLPSNEAIRAAIGPRTKGVLFSNPCNPTGAVFFREELQRLGTLAEEHNLFLIADEVYQDFTYVHPATSMASFPEFYDRLILADSASKRFSLCGIRVGLLASYNRSVIEAVVKYAEARLSVATIEQQALIPVLQQADAVIEPVFKEFSKRRDVVYEELKKIPGVQVHCPEGALYAFCHLPIDSAETFCHWLAAEFEHEGEGLLLAPGTGFYSTPGKGEQEVRIAYVLGTDKLRRALQLLSIALKAYSKR